jgi:hypothetical protein
MRLRDYQHRRRVVCEAINKGATNSVEIGQALIEAGVFTSIASARTESLRIVNHMMKLGRVVRDENGKLRAK